MDIATIGFFRSGAAFMNMLLATLKIIADYYPSRLHKAFVIDPPSIFSYLWKVNFFNYCLTLSSDSNISCVCGYACVTEPGEANLSRICDMDFYENACNYDYQ